MSRSAIVFALLLLLAPKLAEAQAHRREGEVQAALELRLPWAVRFGDALVPAGFYRVAASDAGLSLADPSSMVVVATVQVEKTSSTKTTTPALVERHEHGGEVRIVVKNRNDIFTARGQKTVVDTTDPVQVQLAGKKEALLADVAPEQASDEALVGGALKRYLPSLQGCADLAQRGRWQTDDPRFVKCVCPLVEKWRLPKVKRLLPMHRFLVKGKSGISFVVSPDGRAYGCRVWVGTEPPRKPAPEAQEPAPETQKSAPEVQTPAATAAPVPAAK